MLTSEVCFGLRLLPFGVPQRLTAKVCLYFLGIYYYLFHWDEDFSTNQQVQFRYYYFTNYLLALNLQVASPVTGCGARVGHGLFGGFRVVGRVEGVEIEGFLSLSGAVDFGILV